MRNNIFIKLFFLSSALSLLLFIYMSICDIKEDAYRVREIESTESELLMQNEHILDRGSVTEKGRKDGLKYILQWTSHKTVPFVYMGEGRQGFIDRNCTFTNCFVTANKLYLGDYTKFDVIAFAATEIVLGGNLTKKRSPHQKFVFASIESADNYPLCTNDLNEFFNWTWTYRLDSDAKWGYIVIRDSENRIVGPKANMDWIKHEDMKPTSNDVKEKLKRKTKAAAWFVSNCNSRSNREVYAIKLMLELKKYNLNLNIYGDCGSLSCSRDDEEKCNEIIEKDYYFYLSYENSFDKDYVTEKLLYPLQYLAVPIVYGGANYSRFMPDGIYLDAKLLNPKQLAAIMHRLIQDPDAYAEYFRWRNHYSYHRRSESIETDDYCGFCAILNDEEAVKRSTVYRNFRDWWDPKGRC